MSEPHPSMYDELKQLQKEWGDLEEAIGTTEFRLHKAHERFQTIAEATQETDCSGEAQVLLVLSEACGRANDQVRARAETLRKRLKRFTEEWG